MMNDAKHWIKFFQNGHQNILIAIDQVQMESRSFLKARRRLPELYNVIASYFKREDDVFFDKLMHINEKDPKALKMILFFKKDLKDIKIDILTFFDKYLDAVGEISERNFPKDLNHFAHMIADRLKMEEEYMFPLMQKET